MPSNPKVTENGREIADWLLAHTNQFNVVTVKIQVKVVEKNGQTLRSVTLTKHEPSSYSA
jgi:hypothetical protein